MNEVNARKWIAALRSGEYTQTDKVLEFTDEDGTTSQCCLGVACRVAQQHGIELRTGASRYEVDKDPAGRVTSFDGFDTELPHEVAEWLYISDTLMRQCMGWNDTDGLTFNEIADRLEARL